MAKVQLRAFSEMKILIDDEASSVAVLEGGQGRNLCHHSRVEKESVERDQLTAGAEAEESGLGKKES